MNMESRSFADTPSVLNLCIQLQLWASSQSVTQSVSKQASSGLDCRMATVWKLYSTQQSGKSRINEEEQTLGEAEGHTRKKRSSMNVEPVLRLIKVLFPTRACLNQRRALVPCVGQTTSTNEWLQQAWFWDGAQSLLPFYSAFSRRYVGEGHSVQLFDCDRFTFTCSYCDGAQLFFFVLSFM